VLAELFGSAEAVAMVRRLIVTPGLLILDVQLSDVELKAIHSVIGQAAAELNALKKR
jgi:hypothetical protein